jgi:hypothetical protein
MGGYHGMAAIALAKCEHDRNYWSPCDECRAERELELAEEQARVDAVAKPYRDMVANHRRWFDICAFCPRDALVIRTRHEHDCPFRNTMIKAAARFAVHLVLESDPRAANLLIDPCTTRAEGK